jgi:hypothetical protein
LLAQQLAAAVELMAILKMLGVVVLVVRRQALLARQELAEVGKVVLAARKQAEELMAAVQQELMVKQAKLMADTMAVTVQIQALARAQVQPAAIFMAEQPELELLHPRVAVAAAVLVIMAAAAVKQVPAVKQVVVVAAVQIILQAQIL